MWSSIPFLQALTWWSLVVALLTGVVAAGAGLLSGMAGSRLHALEKATHARELEGMRLRAAELETKAALKARADELREDIDFTMVRSLN